MRWVAKRTPVLQVPLAYDNPLRRLGRISTRSRVVIMRSAETRFARPHVRPACAMAAASFVGQRGPH
eukprot:4352922-Prymnesium_polylepis.1